MLLDIVLMAGAAGLVISQRRFRQRVRRLGEEMANSYATNIVPTLRATVLSVLIALPLPAILALVGWRLSAGWDEPPFCKTLAMALEVTAMVYFATELMRQIVRHRGLAELHFGWAQATLTPVRRHLRWLLVIFVPMTFIVAIIHFQESEFHNSSLGRSTFMFGMGLVSLFAYRVMPKRLETGAAAARSLGGPWAGSLYVLIRMTALYLPLTLAGLAALGYYYTSLQLMCRVQFTLWLLMSLTLVRCLLERWLLVARCRLAIDKARRRRAAAMGDDHDGPTEIHGPTHTGSGGSEADLSAIDVQTRRLFRGAFLVAIVVGGWAIWVDVLPALKYLDQWQLWSYNEATTAPMGSVEGSPTPAPTTVTITRWVSLGDLLSCGVIVLMTIIAGRNLPGLIEIAWLQRLPLDAGGRYAITSVARYVITVAGVLTAFRTLGIGWSSVQWLAAAITFGLGFGLQEIFANFISGLIILFERPMRVGDIVTVGGVSGTVSRIRARATTITDWDRKELIVPNKEFITGQLVNWTLSDSVLRLVIKVGVSYSSDPAVVTRLLREIANENPMIMAEPAPVALLESFGDNALLFELRVFVASPDKMVPTRHALHLTIEERMRHAGIELAFPQCDIHVRDVPPSLSLSQVRMATKAAS